MSNFTSREAFQEAYDTLNATFLTGKTKDIRWRKWQLKQLFWLLTDNEDAIIAALKKDLNRNSYETILSDINGPKNTINFMLNNIDRWAKGEAPEGAGFIMGYLGGAWLRKEPLGNVLIIGTWNFPLYTLLDPAVAAITAGNCVTLKPSESTPATQDVLVELIPKYMDPSAIRIITGAAPEMTHILTHRFDKVFYTGGGKVGRIIAGAAAKHHAPVVLELGGQAPAIVTKTANIELAAKRIAATKLINSGQICLNVNHVFVDPAVHDELVKRMAAYMAEWLKDDTSYLTTIVTPGHYQRIKALLTETAGTTVFTGPHDEATKFMHPTIVTDVEMSDSLLAEELFAPLLPVVKADVETAVKTITSMPHPLGLYIFSSSQQEINSILDRTISGGVTINDAMVHPQVPNAPFGGVGESGYGSYHGKFGFEAFSHTRTVVGLPDWLDRFIPWRYGPPKIENRKYSDVKPTFRRGEKLEDQRATTKFLGLW